MLVPLISMITTSKVGEHGMICYMTLKYKNITHEKKYLDLFRFFWSLFNFDRLARRHFIKVKKSSRAIVPSGNALKECPIKVFGVYDNRHTARR